MDIKVADEVWISLALLQYENLSAKSFSNKQIINRIKKENIYGSVRPGIQTHIVSHCLANKPAKPNRCRMLFSLSDGTKRLYRDSDNCHSSRRNGKTQPKKSDIPKKYRYLLDWYNNEYNRAKKRGIKEKTRSTPIHHTERCLRCKETVQELLQKIYGKVEPNHKFQIGTLPTDFEGTKRFEQLKRIFEALQEKRGFNTFVKAKTLPRCDFFIPTPGFVLEFDESQHFTSARQLALELYPEELEIGFDRKKWIDLCRKINSKDNDPPYRDEQRAWYDTLGKT